MTQLNKLGMGLGEPTKGIHKPFTICLNEFVRRMPRI